MLDMMPRNTTMAVTRVLGAEFAARRSMAEIMPLPSATPTPIMMVKTVPRAKKPVKLLTTVVTRWRMESGVSRLTAFTVFSTMALPLAVSMVS